MVQIHIAQSPVKHSPSLLPIVAQAETLATRTQAALQQPIQIKPAQLSAIAKREAMRALTKTSRLIYDYLFDWCAAQRRAGDTRGVYPSRKHIAAQVECSVSTVQRAFTQFRALGLLAVIARRTTQQVWHRLKRQLTNLIELPSRASLERSIAGLVSRRLRKKRDSNRRKQKVEGSNEGRRALLRAQFQSILAFGQDQDGG